MTNQPIDDIASMYVFVPCNANAAAISTHIHTIHVNAMVAKLFDVMLNFFI